MAGPAAVAQVTVTPAASWASPVTRCPQRTPISGWPAMHSSSICSVRDWEMLTNGGKADRPESAKVTLNSSASRWNVRAVVQVTPAPAMRRPAPTAS